LVDDDADVDAVLSTFNGLVKQKIPQLFQEHFGSVGLPYLGAIAIVLPTWASGVSKVALVVATDSLITWDMFTEILFRNLGNLLHLLQLANCVSLTFWLARRSSEWRLPTAFLVFNLGFLFNFVIIVLPHLIAQAIAKTFVLWTLSAVHLMVAYTLWRRPMPRAVSAQVDAEAMQGAMQTPTADRVGNASAQAEKGGSRCFVDVAETEVSLAEKDDTFIWLTL